MRLRRFISDTGTQADSRLFNRQSILYVSGAFGTVYAGRMYSMISDGGVTGWYGAMASPFGSGWGDIVGHEAVLSMQGGKDNTLIYMSPRFSGLQFSAQYSMGDDGNENKSFTDRYAAIGVDYQAGGLEIGFLADYMNKSTAAFASDHFGGLKVSDNIDKDAWTINLAANYDCGFAKTYAAVQYFKNIKDFSGSGDSFTSSVDSYGDLSAEETNMLADWDRMTSLKGFGVNLGVSVPAFGGNAMASIGYADVDVREMKEKVGTAKGYTALVGYEYPFSKRTNLYAGAGFTQYKLKYNSDVQVSYKVTKYQAMAGLKHTF